MCGDKNVPGLVMASMFGSPACLAVASMQLAGAAAEAGDIDEGRM